ncbi:MAG: hypothetical protein AAF399_07490 [Bacteroidota bacterium]
MKSSRLRKLLQTLTPKEQKSFRRYVDSPYFNRNPRLLLLLNGLLQQDPAHELDKQTVYQWMYQGAEVFEEQKVYDHTSALYKLLESFLAQQQFEEHAWWKKQFLLRDLIERGEDDAFQRLQKQVRQQLAKADLHQGKPDQYLQRYLLHQEADRYFGRQHVRGLDMQDSLMEASENLDRFYFASKLIHTCEMLNRNNIIKTTYSPPLMKELAQLIQTAPTSYWDIPLIAIYLRIYFTLTESEEEDHYEALVKLLEVKSNHFHVNQARDMYGYALNYCTKQLNRGNQRYLGRIFELYQQLLTKGLLLEEGFLAHWHFKNIATVGIRLKEYEWVFGFLDEYKGIVHPEQRENTYNYNLSVWYYEQKKYHQALQQLQKVSFSDVYYDLSARSLVLKIYYETWEVDSLDYHIKAFQSYLRRNQLVSSYQRKIYQNLLRFVRKLYRLQLSKDPESQTHKLQQLYQESLQNREIADLKWLRTNIQELAKAEQIELQT